MKFIIKVNLILIILVPIFFPISTEGFNPDSADETCHVLEENFRICVNEKIVGGGGGVGKIIINPKGDG